MGHFPGLTNLTNLAWGPGSEITLYLSLAAHPRLRSPQAKRSISKMPFHISTCKRREKQGNCTVMKTQLDLTRDDRSRIQKGSIIAEFLLCVYY